MFCRFFTKYTWQLAAHETSTLRRQYIEGINYFTNWWQWYCQVHQWVDNLSATGWSLCLPCPLKQDGIMLWQFLNNMSQWQLLWWLHLVSGLSLCPDFNLALYIWSWTSLWHDDFTGVSWCWKPWNILTMWLWIVGQRVVPEIRKNIPLKPVSRRLN